MNRPDWPGIRHMVHHRLGLLRFEHSLEPSKRKRMQEIFDEEVPTPKKLKLSGILFTEEEIMALDIGWDEALLERLQPAKEPANHKRRTTDDLSISLPQHHHFPTTGDNVEFPIQQEQRSKSEEPTIEGCARQARLRYLDEAAHLPAEHDDSEMPSTRSHSQGRKRTHSANQEDIVDLSDDTAPALPELRQQGEQEGGEAVATTEVSDSESTVVFSRRIKPNSGEKLREQSVTPDPPEFSKTISTGNSGILKAAADLAGGKEENAPVEGNECDQRETSKSSVIVKKPWSYFDGYDERPPSNIRLYGNSGPFAPTRRSTSSEEHRSMAPPKGGPIPVNRLGNNPSDQRPNANPQYKKPESTNGYDTLRKKDPLENTFNLRHDHKQSLGQQRPNKRQKVDGATRSHNGSSRSPIDLETESTRSSRQMAPPASNPECSQTKGPQSHVQEFQNVEETVGFGKKRKSNSGSQTSNGHGAGTKYLRGQQIVRLDDPNDPVSDDEVAVTAARHIKKSPSESARKSNVEIQISSSQAEGGTGYKGTANRRPARQAQKMRSNDDDPEEHSSKYFSSTGKNQKVESKTSARSYPAEAQRPSANSARKSEQQNGTLDFINSPSRSSNHALDPDASLDELNSAEYQQHIDTANNLLAKQKTANAASAKATGRSKQNQTVDVDYSSDDDLANDKANIVPTTFVTTKKGKGKNAPKDERYDAYLIFSEVDSWLVDKKHGSWSLIHNPVFKTLDLLDGGNKPVWTLTTGKIERIEYNSESKLIVIHKARDLTTGKGIHLYIKLRDREQSNDLTESLKHSQPTIQRLKKDISYLHSVIENMLEKVVAYQEKALAMAKKRQNPIEEADDIRLLAANSQRRLEAKSIVPHDSLTSLIGRRTARPTTQEEAQERPRSRGLASGMRTRSSSDCFENDDLPHTAELPEVTPDSFYRRPTSRQDTSTSLYGTRSSTRGQDRELNVRQLRPRNPSPPPLRSWTRENPDWVKDWHNSIIYPAVGKGRARVDMGDIEKLDDGEFLNDNLIVFYLRYLQDKLEQQQPERAKRIYFQNTFFYQKLAKSEKGTKSINYEAVKKWTSKEDILNKDYIIIPINEHSHWYVAIICNTPKLLPGAEATNSSQSQDPNDNLGGDRMDAEDNPRPSSAVGASPKQILKTSGGGDVDKVMEDMSLEDNNLEGSAALQPSTNDVPAGQEIMDRSSPPLANVVSDLIEREPPKTSQTKKTKRKSGPPPRKHNPKEFRIITLDSLGSSHTVTCSNLKDYLVMEIKDKKNIDIERPGSIGTTAKGIPMQNNYYDCGLFLLCYVEMFLDSPDEFISGILQSDEPPKYKMPKAVEMREHIRELLFYLQKEQHAEAERLAKLKGKGKKTSKTDDKSDSTSTSKLSSREASKSVRASPAGQTRDESGDLMERPILSNARSPQEERPPDKSSNLMEQRVLPRPKVSRQEERDPMEQRILPKSSLGMREGTSKPLTSSKSEVPNGSRGGASRNSVDGSMAVKLRRQEEADLGDAIEGAAKSSGMFKSFYSGASKVLHSLLNQDKRPTLDVSNPPQSATDPIEIDDSPQKMDPTKSRLRSEDSELARSSRTLSGNGQSSVERVGQVGGSKSRGQRNAQMNRQSSNVPNGRGFVSPTPDALDHMHRPPAEREVTDLRSPSPEEETTVRSGRTEAQREASVVAKNSNARFSTDRRRHVKASSPEILQTPSPGARDRSSSRSAASGRGNFSDAEVDDSASDDNSIALVGTTTRAREVSENDAEMLLLSTEAPDEVPEDADPPLLSSSQLSISEIGPASKHREGGRSVPSSPNLRYEGRRRSSSSGRKRGTKRKTPGMGETDDWQNHRRASPALRRDGLDQGIIGKHRPSGRQPKFP